jgi:hypothetical protein
MIFIFYVVLLLLLFCFWLALASTPQADSSPFNGRDDFGRQRIPL